MLPLQFFGFGVEYLVTILIIVAAIAVIAIWIVLAVWVYRDANERGMDAAIWLLIVILTGIIGLIIYLIVRE